MLGASCFANTGSSLLYNHKKCFRRCQISRIHTHAGTTHTNTHALVYFIVMRNVFEDVKYPEQRERERDKERES